MAPRKKAVRKIRKPVVARVSPLPSPAPVPSPTTTAGEKTFSSGFLLAALLFTLALYKVACLLHHEPIPPIFQTRVISRISGQGQPCGPFSGWGIASIGRRICIADTGHNRLLVFDRNGRFWKSWGKMGKGPGEFHEPSGMASDGKGNAYVMDAWNGAIKGFDEKGRSILDLELGNTGFFGPRGLACNGNNFMVADTGGNRIVLISPSGNIQAQWGGFGSKPGKFRGPLAVAADAKGNCWVADSGNDRAQWLDGKGRVLKVIPCGSPISAIAVDREGRVYVASVDRVEVYDSRGKSLGVLRDQDGFGDYFQGVRGMSVSQDDVLMVSDGETAFAFQLPKENP